MNTPSSLDELKYTTRLPEIAQNAPGTHRSYKEQREKMMPMFTEMKMWHVAHRPEALRWYIFAQVGLGTTDRRALKVKANYWRNKLKKLDPKYVVTTRGDRMYATYDYDDRLQLRGPYVIDTKARARP